MERNYYLKAIGNGLVLASIPTLFLYFFLWVGFGKMFNEFIFLGTFLGIIALICLGLSKTTTVESSILGIALFVVVIIITTTTLSDIIAGTLTIICFIGAIYFALREDRKKTVPSVKGVHQ